MSKPFKESDIYSLLKNAENIFTEPDTNLYIKLQVGNIIEKVLFDEILFIKADKNYLEIVTKNKKYLERKSMSNFTKNLPESFIQVHKSYIANIKKAKTFRNSELHFDGFFIPVSRRYIEVVKNMI